MPDGQLTTDERYAITHLHMAGHKPAEIARRLGPHRANIGREIGRNADPMGGYHYASAQQQADTRRSAASKRYKLDTPGSIAAKAVRAGLKQRWSPEQIVGRLKLDHPDDAEAWISHEAIYQWVYREAQAGGTSYQRLRRPRKRRRRRIPGDRKAKRGAIPGRIGIEKRPAVVDFRGRFGDWESDTVEGAKGRGLVVTHVERKSRYTLLGKLPDKKAVTLSRATHVMMKGLPKTMTPDNGKEFTDFKTIERELGMAVYFANPHSPWERGLNENTNGLLRD